MINLIKQTNCNTSTSFCFKVSNQPKQTILDSNHPNPPYSESTKRNSKGRQKHKTNPKRPPARRTMQSFSNNSSFFPVLLANDRFISNSIHTTHQTPQSERWFEQIEKNNFQGACALEDANEIFAADADHCKVLLESVVHGECPLNTAVKRALRSDVSDWNINRDVNDREMQILLRCLFWSFDGYTSHLLVERLQQRKDMIDFIYGNKEAAGLQRTPEQVTRPHFFLELAWIGCRDRNPDSVLFAEASELCAHLYRTCEIPFPEDYFETVHPSDTWAPGSLKVFVDTVARELRPKVNKKRKLEEVEVEAASL